MRDDKVVYVLVKIDTSGVCAMLIDIVVIDKYDGGDVESGQPVLQGVFGARQCVG